MRAAFLLQDRPDVSFSTKELADRHAVTDGTINDQFEASRTVFEETSRLVQLFIVQTSTANVVRLDVNGDSDHVGFSKHARARQVSTRDAHCLKMSSHTQSTSHSAVVKASMMELSSAQPLAWARDPCLQIFACVLASWSALTRRVDWRLAHDEDLVASATCRLATCRCNSGVQEGDLRLKKEPGDTNVSDALTKPLEHRSGARVSMTMKIVFQHDLSARVFFWKHAETCSDSVESAEFRKDFLERDGRAVRSSSRR